MRQHDPGGMRTAGRYRAVLFDVFGTLVRFDSTRVPLIELPQGPVRSTVPAYVSLLGETAPGVEPATFHEALMLVSGEIARERGATYREFSSRERFARTLERIGVGGADVDQRAERLSLAHMEQLIEAATVPPGHRALLERLGTSRLLGCISNFDHAATALRILDRAGLARFLRVAIISEAFGVRKPSPAIFHEALRRLGVTPREAVFVGDSLDEDVRGASGAGLDAVWLSPSGGMPGSGPVPAATIRELPEIEFLDGC